MFKRVATTWKKVEEPLGEVHDGNAKESNHMKEGGSTCKWMGR